MSSTITPPGWYDDGHGSLRWWDGSQWTTHTAPLPGQQAPVPPPVQQPVQVQPAQPVQAAPATQVLTYEQERNLVRVKRSKLVWILPLVLVAAALFGAIAGAIAWQGADPAPLKATFREFQTASETGSCSSLEEVTTQDFRDDLVDVEPFTCEAWLAGGHGMTESGDVVWGIRFGSNGILLVEEDRVVGIDDSVSDEVLTTYEFVKQDGQWKIDDSDADYYD